MDVRIVHDTVGVGEQIPPGDNLIDEFQISRRDKAFDAELLRQPSELLFDRLVAYAVGNLGRDDRFDSSRRRVLLELPVSQLLLALQRLWIMREHCNDDIGQECVEESDSI